MLHSISVENCGPQGAPMAAAVSSCVHCGFCLADCPTYRVLQEELDSPRGRILLMKEALEGNLPVDSVQQYVDRCLGCVGCMTSCPSGVNYGELITSFRSWSSDRRSRRWSDRLLRSMILRTIPYPRRFRWAVRLGQLVPAQVAKFLPNRLRSLLSLVPASIPAAKRLPEIYPAIGPRRARVALLSGCAQQVLAPQINWATLRVLAHNGIETVIPRNQSCCGALAAHAGEMKDAQAFARQNLAAFPHDVDAILTNAAGCGSGMREYGLWLRGQPDEEAATAMEDKVRDVSEYLVQIGIREPAPLSSSLKVAYHDACHLVHAQQISEQPRNLLQAIPNLELVAIPNGQICCGSAGIYNIEQPEVARVLGEDKARAILSTGADAVAAGNIGCIAQISCCLQSVGQPLPIYHTVELLDRAYSSATR